VADYVPRCPSRSSNVDGKCEARKVVAVRAIGRRGRGEGEGGRRDSRERRSLTFRGERSDMALRLQSLSTLGGLRWQNIFFGKIATRKHKHQQTSPTSTGTPQSHFHSLSAMANKTPYQTTFEPEHVIQPIYTGGSVALDQSGRILATTLGEDALLTDLSTGRQLAKIEGVCLYPQSY
jgi:hypothetical protein